MSTENTPPICTGLFSEAEAKKIEFITRLIPDIQTSTHPTDQKSVSPDPTKNGKPLVEMQITAPNVRFFSHLWNLLRNI